VNGDELYEPIKADVSEQQPIPVNCFIQGPPSTAVLAEGKLDHDWPVNFACKMAIDEWTTVLENASLTNSYANFLDGF
jgi:hypothetical protein